MSNVCQEVSPIQRHSESPGPTRFLIQCQKLTHYNLPLFFSSRKIKYRYRPGTTPVMTEKVVPLKLEVVQESVQQMDTA